MSEFVLKPASRGIIRPLVGFFGLSGSGKTLSALLYARGLVGPNGKIALVDSETGRGSLFSDLVKYEVVDITPPFTPARYQQAFEVAEAGSDIVVMDSLSHEWDGEGGVLEWHEKELQRMAGDNWEKREKCSQAAWVAPKAAHKKFVQRMLRAKGGVVCCLRGERKTRIGKGDNNKTTISTDDFASAIFDQRFFFEMLVNFETVTKDRGGPGGFVRVQRLPHPTAAVLLPGPDEQVSVKHGELMAAWCANPNRLTGQPPKPAEDPEVTRLKREIWELTKAKHNGSRRGLNQWLIDETLISDTEVIETMPKSRLEETLAKVKLKLQ